jgi:DNA-binding transcriptional LysR family regulator
LRVFEAVARLGGLNRAAAELKTVASNIHSRIRLLEEEVGVPLFQRHSRGVTLTNAGHRLLPYATEIVQVLEEARRALEGGGNPEGRLTVGSLETTAAHRLPSIISSYGKAFPAVNISLRTATNVDLIRSVLNHEIDGAFVCGPVDHPELEQDVVFHEELVVATAPGQKRFAKVAEAGELKILVKGTGCAYRERLEQILVRDGISFSRIEFGTLDAIIGCVADGLGETLLPESVLAHALKERRVIAHRLHASDSKVETLFVRRRDAFVSSALAAFLQRALKSKEMTIAAGCHNP